VLKKARPFLEIRDWGAAGRVRQGIARRLSLAYWRARTTLSRQRPRIMLAFSGSLGDHLLCTAVFRELRRRGYHDLWMLSNHRGLFRHNRDIDLVVPQDSFFVELARIAGGAVYPLTYARHVQGEDRDVPPARHIIACMCQAAGIGGPIDLRPYLALHQHERGRGRLAARQIAIQSSGLGAQYPMRNKEWYPERYQPVVDTLAPRYTFVQLGLASDPPLQGALDLRGKTTPRQSAAILSASLAFVGQVGFLMHLARAVDCRAVILYGGREHPSQSGYPCNENLFSAVPCAPCWRWNTCAFDRMCMRMIDADTVVAAVERQVARYGVALELATDMLPDSV